MLANIANKLKYLYFPLTNFRPYIVYTVCMYKYSRRCQKKKTTPSNIPPQQKAIEHIMAKALFQPRSRQCIEKSERVIAIHICGTI